MKAFLKQVTASFFGSCFSVGFVIVFLFIGVPALIVAILSSLTESITTEVEPTVVYEKNILVIDLERGFSDAPTFGPANAGNIFSGEQGPYGVLDTIRALKQARADDRIAGVLLIGGNFSGPQGFASVIELRDALMQFRDLGKKPIFAYLPSPSYKDYLLSSVATQLWIHPFSELPLNGLSSSGIYLKNAFEKIGLGVQITRVGTHKSAIEPLISDAMSPEDREQRSRILNTFWDMTLQHIVASRNGVASGKTGKQLPADILGKIKNTGIFPAALATENNLIDAALYEDEMIERLKEIAGSDDTYNSFCQIALNDYMRATGIASEPPLTLGEAVPLKTPSIAVVFAEGEIVDGYGSTTDIGGKRFSRILRQLRTDDTIRAVVLRINSPGGSVFASEQIRREAQLLAEKKTLVVSMGDTAASGGYWISTPAKKVFAKPSTVTGSIGVFGVLFNLEAMGKKIGVNTDAVLTAPLAELGTTRRPKTPQEMAVFQKMTNDIYAKFLQLVATARDMDVSAVDAIAQGQVWSGLHAKQLNLIDEFGGLEEAIEFARKDAELDESCPVISVPGEVNRFQELFNMLDDTTVPVASGGDLLRHNGNPALRMVSENLSRISQRLRAFNDPNGLYARMPFDIEAE